MTATFTAAAAQLAGIVPRVLGWQPQNFWEATPAEVAAIFASTAQVANEPLSREELTTLLEIERRG